MKVSLHIKVLIALALGVAVGLALNAWGAQVWSSLGVNDARAYWAGETSEVNAGAGAVAYACWLVVAATQFVGDLFVRCLRLIAVPVILFSLVQAVGSIADLRTLGRVGARTCGLFLVTCLISVSVGLSIANIVKPGASVDPAVRDQLAAARAAEAATRVEAGEKVSASQTLLNMVPSNPFRALADGDMMQVVVISLLLGAALAALPRIKAAPVLAVCEAMTEAIITFVGWLMKLAPMAVFALLTPVIATMGFAALKALAAYCLCVLGGLGFVLFVLYPVVLRLATPMKVRDFFRGIAPAQALAFSSSSSAATLPVTIQCVRQRLGVPEDITSFVCSLGTTVNMDGTALMQATAAVFIAQLYSVDLSPADQLIIALTATIAAVGSPGIPSGGIVMLVIVLESVGIPVQGIAIILAVDRVLDMCRTVVNVTGDALAAVFVAGMERRPGQPGRGEGDIPAPSQSG